ncbi:hypothetical protein PAHAL_8G027000 [Panicum hallii]|jgi:hypothetical protein|uniref:Glycosyltransferase n=1 Tax=Panicum hallii TaxID=206008 RepID=A0A2S3ICB1_9POAL|nr:cyanidin 3-O-rutinoside 5-O-glucosyltransferase-like [Panicum hallii]PAN41217.1 hypothetical protein PAHAL_8G027000 [Panicum hallii]
MADDEGRHQRKIRHHFLLVSYGFQSHINPGRVLAHRLARLGGVDGGPISVTLSVPAATYRCMFPSPDADAAEATTTDGVISYVPYSDGVDDGSMPRDAADRAVRRRATSASLSAAAARLAGSGRPVTCIMCTVVSLPVVDVARELDIPVAVYWIQTATLLAINYHYFVHGYSELVAAHAADPAHELRLPGLSRPLQISNLPSYLTDMSGSESAKAFSEVFQEFFQYMGQWQPKVLVATLDELEPDALAEMKRHVEVFTVAPMVGSSTEARIHLFKHDSADKKRYMGWLQAHPEKSVVYVSFGSLSKYTKHQMDEIVGGLRQCGRPYLLVVRRDGIADDDDESGSLEKSTQSQGMVVDWCNQLEVLSHPAVGCFVSHCGWNSTMEAMVSGVPIVGVPNMFDQPTNVLFIEEEWEVGIKAERSGDGVLMGTELARCVELVMGEGAKAMAIREKAKALKEVAQAAAGVGGSAERNLRDFVKAIPCQNQ